MLTLYYALRACSMAAHVALEEAGATYDPRVVDIFSGEHMTPEYAAINPRSRVPALRLGDGSVLVENTAILTWIARAYPERNLAGRNETERAHCLSHCSWLSSTVHPAFARIVRAERFAVDDSSKEAVQTSAKATFWQSLQEIDRMLTGRNWLMGESFTVCDPYALVFYGWGAELELTVKQLVNYTALKDRLLERPLARKVLEREQSILLTL